MKNINQLKMGTLLSYVNMAINTVIPLLYTPIMLRILGQGEYGLYSLSGSVTSYLSLLTLGLGSTIHRFYMRHITANDKKMVERTMGLFVLIYLVLAVVIIAVGCAMTWFTGTLFAKGLSNAEIKKMNMLVVLLSINAGISLLAVPFSSIVVCHEKYIFQKVFAIIGTMASPLINLAVLYAGFASVGMAVVGVAWALVSIAVNFEYCRKRLSICPVFTNLPVEMVKEIFAFTIIVFVGQIADLLYWSTDKVLIGAMLGTTAVAVYNIGTTFNSVMQQMASAISGVFGTRVNKLVFSEQPMSAISELMTKVGRIQFLLISLILSGFIVFGRPFLALWVGDGYRQAYEVALLTMLPMVIPLIQNVAFIAVVAMNKHRFRSVIYTILAVANVASTYFLIPHMGIIGAAACTFLVFILGHGVIMNWFYHKKIGLDVLAFWKNILKMSMVPVVLVIASFIIGVGVNSIRQFIAGIAVYTAFFCILSWLLVMNQFEKQLVRGMLAKIWLLFRMKRK